MIGRLPSILLLHQSVFGNAEDLKKIDVPTLIMHGNDDPKKSKARRILAAQQ
jgi:pimeloyl-ACP methyl ester carboxylesterase